MIGQEHDGMQVGFYLKQVHHYSRNTIIKIKQNREAIAVNGQHIRMVDKLSLGDCLVIRLFDEPKGMRGFDVPVEVCFENEQVLVFNKPPFMPTHPSRFHPYDTLGNVFAAYGRKNGWDIPFRPITRLDKDTSGAVLIAKNAYAAARLQKGVQKEYLAIVCGHLKEHHGFIDAPIGRVCEDEIKRMVRPDGQSALTEYWLLEEKKDHSLVKVKLHTGRTHQIRVHFAYIGHPLVGDPLYGGQELFLRRQALHCSLLRFKDPITQEEIEVRAPLHADMQELIKQLCFHQSDV